MNMNTAFIETALENWKTLGDWDFDKVFQYLNVKYNVQIIYSTQFTEPTFPKLVVKSEKIWLNNAKNTFVHDTCIESMNHDEIRPEFRMRRYKELENNDFVDENVFLRLVALYKTKNKNMLHNWWELMLDTDFHEYVYKLKYYELYLTHRTPISDVKV